MAHLRTLYYWIIIIECINITINVAAGKGGADLKYFIFCMSIIIHHNLLVDCAFCQSKSAK